MFRTTGITQRGMNGVLALAIPLAGIAYLMSAGSATATWSVVGACLALFVLWTAATVALDGGDARLAVTSQLIPGKLLPRPPAAGTVNVDRPSVPWRATSVLMMPLELLAVVWAVPLVILLIMAPIGLVIAAALWAGRMLLGL